MFGRSPGQLHVSCPPTAGTESGSERTRIYRACIGERVTEHKDHAAGALTGGTEEMRELFSGEGRVAFSVGSKGGGE